MLVWSNTISDKFHYRTAVYETRTLGGVRGALRQFLAEPSTRLTEPVVCRLSTMGIGLNWRVAIQRFGWRLSFLFSTFFFFHCLLLHRFLSLGNPIIVFHVFPCFLSNRHPLRRVNSVLQGIISVFVIRSPSLPVAL